MYNYIKYFISILIIIILVSPVIYANNQDHILLNELGFKYLQNKKYSNAIKCFQKSISLSKEFTVAYNNLGSTYYRMKQYDKAIKYFKTVIRQEEHYVKAYVNLAACFFKKKEYFNAYKHYYKSINIDKNYVKERLNNEKAKKKLTKEIDGTKCNEALRIYQLEMEKIK